MKRPMVGQCNTADFRHLEHLADWLASGGEVDFTSLTKRQSTAVMVLSLFQDQDEGIDLCLKLKEVLVYKDEHERMSLVFKLHDQKDRATRDKIRAIIAAQR